MKFGYGWHFGKIKMPVYFSRLKVKQLPNLL